MPKSQVTVLVAVVFAVAFGLGIIVGRKMTTPGGTTAKSASLQTPAETRVSNNRPNQPPAESQSTGIFINERELTPEQVQELVQVYRFPPPRGRFWYDSRSGLYGVWGREAAGYIHPGHNFAPLPANASTGNTGVFINGRELNMAEVNFFQILFNGQVRPGRVWLDGSTWNIGVEGSPYPVANLAVALQQQQQQSRGGKDWGWRDGSGAAMASDGNCTMMAVPGAPVYGTSGCN